jgi:hypothetical protein
MILIGIDPGFHNFAMFAIFKPNPHTKTLFCQDVADLCPGENALKTTESSIAPALCAYLDNVIAVRSAELGITCAQLKKFRVIFAVEAQARKLGPSGRGSRNPMINHIIAAYCACRGYEYFAIAAGKKTGNHTANKKAATEQYDKIAFAVDAPVWSVSSQKNHIADAAGILEKWMIKYQ